VWISAIKELLVVEKPNIISFELMYVRLFEEESIWLHEGSSQR
jgi:hypothetical protein